MKNFLSEKVNVFQGTGRSVTPDCDGLFSNWNLLKGKAGNTSPSACLPFGCVACSPYSGGYSSGYGNFKRNGGLPPEAFFDGDKIIGFSHFTHSGSGAFGFYYNYLLTVPVQDDLKNIHELKPFDEENGKPGYYTCRLIAEKIKCEVTVADKVAIHRYTALNEEPIKIAVDISNDGLKQPQDKGVYGYSSESKMRIEESGVSGYVTMQGVKIYFYILCEGESSLWLDKKSVTEREMLLEKTDKPFGCLFETPASSTTVKIGFSLVSEENAKNAAVNSPNFDEAKEAAEKEWEKRLSTVELFGVSEEDREIFYSNYYHTLVKPCGWRGESFLWEETETFYLDFATLWDVYKTQTPLLFTLHGDVGRGIVKTLLRYGKEKGKLFNALMLSANMNIESTQACCLGCYVLYDGYIRSVVASEDIDDMFAVVKAEISQYEKEIKDGTFEKTTKLLDCTLIAAAFAEVAAALGRKEDEKYLSEIATCWTDGFGEDGLLKENYPYYEGNRWNYSFRFVKDKEKRLAIGGGKETITKQLDAFFGFTNENEIKNRFEGFNNETDMETPYFYHYVDRYDRLADILDECVTSCFKRGRNGLPGNNDSGGLSACYLWNFLGLFPISGQDKFFVGVPKAQKTVLHLQNGKKLTIVAMGEGKGIDAVTLDGEVLKTREIPVEKIMQGGEIVFYKGKRL